MSESDFVNITHNGELCNAEGEIGQGEFHAIMRREVLPREREREKLFLLRAIARHTH